MPSPVSVPYHPMRGSKVAAFFNPDERRASQATAFPLQRNGDHQNHGIKTTALIISTQKMDHPDLYATAMHILTGMTLLRETLERQWQTIELLMAEIEQRKTQHAQSSQESTYSGDVDATAEDVVDLLQRRSTDQESHRGLYQQQHQTDLRRRGEWRHHKTPLTLTAAAEGDQFQRQNLTPGPAVDVESKDDDGHFRHDGLPYFTTPHQAAAQLDEHLDSYNSSAPDLARRPHHAPGITKDQLRRSL